MTQRRFGGRDGGRGRRRGVALWALLCLGLPGWAVAQAPAGDEAAGEAPAGDEAAGEAPTDEAPADEAPADEAPAGDTAADNAPADEAPADEAPADNAPADNAPADGARPAEPSATPAQTAPATAADDAPAGDPTAAPAPALVPPVLVASREPPFPAALRERGPFAGEARLVLTVDAAGEVTAARSAGADDPLFEEALRATLPAWRFEPARLGGEPVAVELPLVWRFIAPPVPVRGRLARRGVRAPVVGITVSFEPAAAGAAPVAAVSDVEGRFAVALPPGPYTLRIDDPAVEAHAAAVAVRGVALDLGAIALTPAPGFDDVLEVRARRDEGSTRLDAAELARSAGSLGDPLRVLQSLPSVGTYLSLIPFPIVRGSPPGEVGIAVDGTRIPLMFHSAVGVSVVPPQVVEAIELHPGIAPLRFGRFTGAAIEAFTHDPIDEGWLGEASIDLAQASALVSVPIGEGGRLTVTGRTSYANWLLEALDQPVELAFDDYHLRYTWRDGGRRLRVSLFGATDAFGDRDLKGTEMAFHRLALRFVEPLGGGSLEAALDAGIDQLDLPTEGLFVVFRGAAGEDLLDWIVTPRLVFTRPLGAAAALELGVEGERRWTDSELRDVPARQDTLGAWGAVRFEAGPLTVTPGLRLDLYDAPFRWSLDPRVDARYTLAEETALVARAGLMSGPQRYDWPIPGAGAQATDTLQRAWQLAAGVEQGLAAGLELTWSVFASRVDGMRNSALDPTRRPTIDEVREDLAQSPPENARRAQGSELLLRRRPGGWWSGWIAYTVQRVERRDLTGRWLPSALEQQHLLNVVLTLRLPDHWYTGGRFHYTSGRPLFAGSLQRLDAYAQLDLRVEKRWFREDFEIGAYLDVVNVTRSAEDTRQDTFLTEIDSETGTPELDYILPMLGVRARF
ncbi:MAG: energy transducer TonB [bacterium]